MNHFMQSIGTAIRRMFRALFSWGIVAGVAAIGWVALQSHRAPAAADWVLIGVIALIAGLLGAVSTLAWELSHLGQISRAMRSAHARQTEHNHIAH